MYANLEITILFNRLDAFVGSISDPFTPTYESSTFRLLIIYATSIIK